MAVLSGLKATGILVIKLLSVACACGNAFAGAVYVPVVVLLLLLMASGGPLSGEAIGCGVTVVFCCGKSVVGVEDLLVCIKRKYKTATTIRLMPPTKKPPVGKCGASPPPPGPSSVGISISSCVSMRAQMASAMSGTGKACSLPDIICSYDCLSFIYALNVAIAFVTFCGLRSGAT